ncbi:MULTISPECIES: FAD-dependent oxidoreductase [Sphingobium]|uniref:GMC oxidoreductase n=2 Tax=Sphingobium TaxID=165695 RepID=A0A1E1EY51_9SPHN|nr:MULTISPECIES: GMC family oxidoreductase [Sphingobium]BAV63197.1 GMC oxidoreductase [Sphingobium cloacae]BBD96649.1 GMC family oxidoreductase [Sphingobium amiense]
MCVVGAGAAGITLARKLLESGIDVVLLESGGIDFDPEIAALNEGEITGLDYYDLENARLRFFGGSTAIWGGRCAELDPIDFAKRSWVEHSGWPVSWAQMQPYYRQAREILGLRPRHPVASDLIAAGIAMPDFNPDRIRSLLWTFDEIHGRFSFDNCRDLRDHPRCRIVTQATVQEVVAAPSARTIDHLDVRSLSGNRITVRARHYVLATGGIENARLLLASRSIMPMGLGNGHDWVGRCFMEHPHARGGRVISGKTWLLLNAFAKRHRVEGQPVAALLAPGIELQKEQGLLNTSLTIAGRQPPHGRESYAMRTYGRLKHEMAPDRRGRRLWMTVKKNAHRILRYSEPARPWVLNKMRLLDVALLVRAEQAPNRESRVMLSNLRDPMGVPISRLHWRTSAIDTHSVAGLVHALDAELRRLNLGTVEAAPWLEGEDWQFDPLVSAHPIGGYHHMGTTRMSDSPHEGVTDSYGRVHGIENLSIAGSSLFLTSGWANPTLTIIALACRTAAAIVEGLKAGEKTRSGMVIEAERTR